MLSFVSDSEKSLLILGEYRKEGATAATKPSFHVQFFGWNDESGWVTSVVEFDGLEAFQQLGGKNYFSSNYMEIAVKLLKGP